MDYINELCGHDDKEILKKNHIEEEMALQSFDNIIMQAAAEDSEDKPTQNGRWTRNEHKRFLTGKYFCALFIKDIGLHLHGRNWRLVKNLIKTRS